MPDDRDAPGSVPEDPTEGLSLLVQAATEYAIFTLDVDGNVTSWNQGAEHMKGYAPAEILGRHFSTFYPPEAIEQGKPDQLLSIAVAEGSVEDEGWRVRKDGSRFWADVVITALRGSDGRLRGFGKVTRDLTERRRGEEAARASEERFRLLVESVQDYGIFMLDPEGRVASWNRGAQRLKGYRADEILGRHFSLFYPDEEVRAGRPQRELELAKAHGAVEDEGWRVRKDGSRFWANVVITALRDASGELQGFAKVTRDLTERKRAEDVLRGVLEREREVANQLRAMDKTKDEILSVVAHDLRSPISVIDGYLDLLGQGWDTMGDAEKRDVLRHMAASTNRLRILVNDVMDVTRIDMGEVRYDIASFDADALATRVVEEVAGADVSRVRLEPSAGASATALGDEHRAWQVLANLVSNALKFSPPDASVHVRVEDAMGAGEVRFTVEDRGPGVAPDDHQRIFEKFSRVRGRVASAEGTGLGLYIARSLAEGQGGRIELRSTLGEGSTFTFVLPRADLEERPTAPAADEQTRARPSIVGPEGHPKGSRRREAPGVHGRRASARIADRGSRFRPSR